MDYKCRSNPLYYSIKEDIIRVILKSPFKKTNHIGPPKEFGEVLFSGKSTVGEVNINAIYDMLINTLVKTHNQLKRQIIKLRIKFPWETKNLSVTHANAIAKIEETENSITLDEESKEPSEYQEKKKWITKLKGIKELKLLESCILNDIWKLKNDIIQLWNQYFDVLILIPHQVAVILLEEYNKERKEYFGNFIDSNVIKVTLVV